MIERLERLKNLRYRKVISKRVYNNTSQCKKVFEIHRYTNMAALTGNTNSSQMLNLKVCGKGKI